MGNTTNKKDDARFFNTPRAYNLQAKGVRIAGRSAGLGNGLRMHEFELMADRASILPVGLPENVVWMGYVRRGALKALLPDLGSITIKQGQWFILRAKDLTALADWENDAKVVVFSFCVCVMNRLLPLADEAIRPRLGLFATNQQLLPAALQGTASARLRELEATLRIEECKSKDDALHLANRARSWIRELFHQQELAEANAVAFGGVDPFEPEGKEPTK